MYGIPNSERFARVEPLNKGWSNDTKYRVETVDGEKLLLRVADRAEYGRKKAEYGMLERAARLGVPMTRPVAFGLCGDGQHAYLLLTWCEGADAEEALPRLPPSEHYALGIKAGALLKTLHTLPAPEDAEPWGLRFRRKAEGRIRFYREHLDPYEDLDHVVRFLENHKALPDGRPQRFNHGDFNLSNLIVTPDGQIGVIDFNAYNAGYGDPWWEFCSNVWGKPIHGHFRSGMIDGYFQGRPPEDFFRLLEYYYAYDALAAACETDEMDEADRADGRRQAGVVLAWFKGFGEVVPTWYSAVDGGAGADGGIVAR